MLNLKTPSIRGEMHPRFDEILTPEALAFVGKLDAAIAGRRAELLIARDDRQKRITAGEQPDFLPETAGIRDDPSWQVAPTAPGLADRRCEITGPPTKKMTVNALNSGASVWMADFEDSTAPSWFNVIDGQLNLHDALRGTIDFTDDNGRTYQVGDTTPTVMVRPRGWRLCEKHLSADGRPLPASVVDFGLYLFHNAQWLIDTGAGPYFYLPKLESHLEARMWNDLFLRAEELLGLPVGTIRATVLIETFPAAFEMEEILYELREHSAGLNAGRWDYIFSYIKTFAGRGPEFVLPDRSSITMTTPMMRAYTELLVDTCHRRGAQAIGGMAAFVPTRDDEQATREALAKVSADKAREAEDGFDGSWVAHPALVRICLDAFTGRPHDDAQHWPARITADDLLGLGTTPGRVTISGVRTNIAVALRYLYAWVGGAGAVAIDSMMEDAATVEISRTQIWQWLHHRTRTAEGLVITPALVDEIIEHVVDGLHETVTTDREHRHVEEARDVFIEAAMKEELPDFFTPYAYVRYLIDRPLQPKGPISRQDLRRSIQGPFPAPELVGATH
ncbi:malate synthase A [Nakamurella deserti]|uniref:malate synthase A n=1 Tax=Nakamurella deserti TaxID=2164074 RepID=UPI000DBE2320|nr:malate synthase A [Nakamurella deserti]